MFEEVASLSDAIAAVRPVLEEVLDLLDRFNLNVAAAHIGLGLDSLPNAPTDISHSVN